MPRKPTQAPRIAPALASLVIPIDQLTGHPRNARQGDVGAISQSLARFGQQKPIVAQRRDDGPHVVVAGNHLLAAARALGWTEVAANVADMDDATALAYLVADNRTQELGSYDEDVLASILSDLAKDGDLEGTGYDGDDVDSMLDSLAPKDPVHGDAGQDSAPDVWGVVIECHSEGEQADLLSEFVGRGLSVRALVS
jgi:ParB-like chromosome segregation protein Spo0J